jgi:hypothetical protein
MSTLIFQVLIKQWNKGQDTSMDVAARAAMPDRYSIASKPEYFILDKACIVDQHGDDLATNVYPDGRLKTALMPDGSVKIDRFLISKNDDVDVLAYSVKNQKPVIIADLNQGWIQSRYSWRYAVEQGDQFYWLYEEFTLNAVCLQKFETDYFLRSSPRLNFDAPV